MATTFRRDRSTFNIWPGFVDALATLLIVIIFLVMIFAVAQFYLSALLSGRDEALERLNAQVNELAELLNLERTANTDLRQSIAQLSGELQSSMSERDDLAAQMASLTGRLEGAEDRVASVRAELEEALMTIQADKETIELKLQEIVALEAARDALKRQLEEDTARLATELEEAYKSIAAERETVELQLRELAGLDAARRALEEALNRQRQAARQETDTLQAARAELTATLDKTAAELAEANATIDADDEKIRLQLREIAALEAAREALEKRLQELARQAQTASRELDSERTLSSEAAAKVDLLNRQVAELRRQIAALNEALEASEAKNTEQQVQIANLGQRLNVALASKVQELARYRSEFFGRLREALGTRSDIRIVGDRFIVQSEVLFATGSAELEPAGQEQMRALAGTLREIAALIPDDIDWVLQVEGHTDKRPINSFRFPSNWELSTGRAISVVQFLTAAGLPPERLAAAGYGEFRPIDTRDDEIAYRRNRRIELKLTQRSS
jgi:chemotaxis protein MotB